MKKLRFLLLNANIIIKLHELGIWGRFLIAATFSLPRPSSRTRRSITVTRQSIT